MVTAPSDADDTNAAYFAITPRPCAARAASMLRPPHDLGLGHVEVEAAIVDIDDDLIALFHDADRPAQCRLRRHVPDHQPVRAAAEAAVGDERHVSDQALADKSGSDGKHLLHAGAADRSFEADDDHVAGTDALGAHGVVAGRLRVEYARRPAELAHLMAGQLDDAAIRRQ